MSKPISGREFDRAAPVIGHNLPDDEDRRATLTLRSFDLPNGLYVATVGLYFAFLAVMAAAFAEPGMIIPMAICVIYLIMAFGVPALWVGMKPDHDGRPMDWNGFVRHGVATHTGHMTARDAAIQVLILPVLIFGWGLGIAAIVATLP